MQIFDQKLTTRERNWQESRDGNLPIPSGYPQKIPTTGRVKTRILGMDMGMGNYPQNWTGMGAGTGTLVPTPYTHIVYIYLF